LGIFEQVWRQRAKTMLQQTWLKKAGGKDAKKGKKIRVKNSGIHSETLNEQERYNV